MSANVPPLPEDAVEFHSERVEQFASMYDVSRAFRQRVRVWSRLITSCADPTADVLDIGCGVGTFSFIASQQFRSVVGVDGSETMIAEARHRGAGSPNVTFRPGRLEKVHEGHAPVSLVLCSSVIEYVENFDLAMDALAAVTAPGGHLIVSVPNSRSPYRTVEAVSFRLLQRPAYFRHVRNFKTVREMRNAGLARGMRLEQYCYYGLGPLRTLVAFLFCRDGAIG